MSSRKGKQANTGMTNCMIALRRKCLRDFEQNPKSRVHSSNYGCRSLFVTACRIDPRVLAASFCSLFCDLLGTSRCIFVMRRVTAALGIVCALTVLLASAAWAHLGSETSLDASALPSNITELIRSYGYPAEDHFVTTSDGFILSITRINRGGVCWSVALEIFDLTVCMNRNDRLFSCSMVLAAHLSVRVCSVPSLFLFSFSLIYIVYVLSLRSVFKERLSGVVSCPIFFFVHFVYVFLCSPFHFHKTILFSVLFWF